MRTVGSSRSLYAANAALYRRSGCAWGRGAKSAIGGATKMYTIWMRLSHPTSAQHASRQRLCHSFRRPARGAQGHRPVTARLSAFSGGSQPSSMEANSTHDVACAEALQRGIHGVVKVWNLATSRRPRCRRLWRGVLGRCERCRLLGGRFRCACFRRLGLCGRY